MNYLKNFSYISALLIVVSCSSNGMNKEIALIKMSETSTTVLVNGIETERIYFDNNRGHFSVVYLDSKDSLALNLKEKTGAFFSLENDEYVNRSDFPLGRKVIDNIISKDSLTFERLLCWSENYNREELFTSLLTDGREVKKTISRSQSSDTVTTSLTDLNSVFNHFSGRSFSSFQAQYLINYENLVVNELIRREVYEFENGSLMKEYIYSDGNLSKIKSIVTGDVNFTESKTFIYH